MHASLSRQAAPRVVFVGAGHAHLYALKHAREFLRHGYEVVAVAPENFWYSGMATGVLGGRYGPEEDQIEVDRLLREAGAGARFVRDHVTAIDPHTRSMALGSGERLSWDVLSLNLGSEARALPGSGPEAFAIKPLRRLWELRQRLEEARAQGLRPRVLVAGAGASGCEVAANLRHLLGREGGTVRLLGAYGRIVPEFAAAAATKLAHWMAEHRIEVQMAATVTHLEGKEAVLEDGGRQSFDFFVNATGLHSPALLAESGLPVTDRGELLVSPFLHSTGHARIFGGGDCIALEGRPLEKNGVYAVRQGPVLFRNLLATLRGEPLHAWHPQRHCLLILNLGNGEGLLRWRGLHWRGRIAFRLKQYLDRAFLRRFRPRAGR